MLLCIGARRRRTWDCTESGHCTSVSTVTARRPRALGILRRPQRRATCSEVAVLVYDWIGSVALQPALQVYGPAYIAISG